MNLSKCFIIIQFLLVAGARESSGQFFIGETQADTNTIATHLDTPWEILWGPDDHIWFTERYGRISRIDPESGDQTVLLTIDDVYEESESGLLGMALHPDFEDHPYVYVVYTYQVSAGVKEKLVRYTYEDEVLGSPFTLIGDIPGANRHDGSRLVIDESLKLFMTTGDAINTNNAQDLASLNGKVLRMNLDGSVPEDNPLEGSFLWSWGHRNPQGLVLDPTGIMYSSEHGPSNDDEVNIIEKGRNYGWPDVEGPCNMGGEVLFCADSNVFEPIASWSPTLAVAGMDYYHQEAFPEWDHNLLLTTLKEKELVVLGLSADGRSVESEQRYFDNWFGRLRDLCISPEGRIFLAVSNLDGRGSPQSVDDRIVEIAPLGSGIIGSRIPEFTLYPNPVTGRWLNVRYSVDREAILTLHDALGRMISKMPLTPASDRVTIPLPESSGLYVVTLTGDKGFRSVKVLKQ